MPNRLLVMYVMKNREDENRIGISVSKRVGNSVVRHHITRLLREIFRLNNNRIKTGLNIILVAKRGCQTIGLQTFGGCLPAPVRTASHFKRIEVK